MGGAQAAGVLAQVRNLARWSVGAHLEDDCKIMGGKIRDIMVLGFKHPFSRYTLFSWPNSRISVMGGAQAAGVLAQVRSHASSGGLEDQWDEEQRMRFSRLRVSTYSACKECPVQLAQLAHLCHGRRAGRGRAGPGLWAYTVSCCGVRQAGLAACMLRMVAG